MEDFELSNRIHALTWLLFCLKYIGMAQRQRAPYCLRRRLLFLVLSLFMCYGNLLNERRSPPLLAAAMPLLSFPRSVSFLLGRRRRRRRLATFFVKSGLLSWEQRAMLPGEEGKNNFTLHT